MGSREGSITGSSPFNSGYNSGTGELTMNDLGAGHK